LLYNKAEPWPQDYWVNKFKKKAASLVSDFILVPVRRITVRIRRARFLLLEYKEVKFLVALTHRIGLNDISNMSASIAYYAFLSLFPLLLGLIAILGLFFPSESILEGILGFLAQYLPGSRNLLEGNITDIIRFRGAFGIIGILGLFWSGSGVLSVVSRAINKAWDIEFKHPFYIQKPKEIGIALAVGILILLSLGSSTVLSMIGNIDLPISGFIANVGTALVGFLLSLVVFSILYKMIPITWISWRHVWPGALMATIFFEVAKTLFVFYLNHYNNYDRIYGSIASVIVLLVWIYYSAFILLLGAEVNSMFSRMQKNGEDLESLKSQKAPPSS
jgi:membrane protein